MNHSLPDETTMYQALLDKDSSFEGLFFVGVKTMGIFCRPTCTARKPKKEKNLPFHWSSPGQLFKRKSGQLCKRFHTAKLGRIKNRLKSSAIQKPFERWPEPMAIIE